VEGRDENADLKAFITRMKQYTGFYFKKTFGRQLWQRYGYEHVIHHDEPTRAIIRYILENPIRAGLARTVADYRFIGSSEYTVEQLVDYCRSSG
jgi:REP element-mobilizing transposase RayT